MTYGTSKRGPKGKKVATYVYKAGGREFFKVRFENKAFAWNHWKDGQEIHGVDNVPMPLYHDDELHAADPAKVWIAEGEKDADRLRSIGLIATTVPNGALVKGKAWEPAHTFALRRFNQALILEDNDRVGREHAGKVAAALHGVIPDVRVIRLPDLPEHGDVSDWLDAGHTKDELVVFAEAAPKWEPSKDDGVVVTRLSEIEPGEVKWIWPAYIPYGMLTILDGKMKLGKSTLLQDIVARVTKGGKMPDGTGGGEPRNVILLSAEEDYAVTVRPRLDAAGADVSRVVTISIKTDMGTRMPDLSPKDLARVEAIARAENAAMIAFDPLSCFLPDGTQGLEEALRPILGRLKYLAERTGAGVVANRHWGKQERQDPTLRGLGSVSYNGQARTVLSVGIHRDDVSLPPGQRRRVLAVAGTNIAATAPSWAFRLTLDPKDLVPHVDWLQVVDLSSEDLGGEDLNRGPRESAKAFLKDILHGGGWVPEDDVKKAAQAEEIKDATLRRAREDLGVTRENDCIRTEDQNGTARTYWRLPTPHNAQVSGTCSSEHSPMNEGEHFPMNGHGDAYEEDLP